MVDFASLGVFISIVGSTIAGLIHTIQNSRCTKINACGILSCDRDVLDPTSLPSITEEPSNPINLNRHSVT